jgi:hypothetical protein
MVIGDDVCLLVHTAWEKMAILQERQKTECVEQVRPIEAQEALGVAIIPVVRLKSFHFSADMRRGELAMTVRRSNSRPLTEHMALEALYLREKAETLPVGVKRDDLLRKARRLEVASQPDNWLRSPS